jgi:hypothetical protein
MAVVAPPRRQGLVPLSSAEARDRSIRRRVGITWALLYFNTLTYTSGSILHIPSHVGKGIAQAALPLALVVALTVNPKIRLRPNVFLCLMCLLAVDTVLTAVQVHAPGTTFRTFRLIEFVAALWLLTPWWGRRDLLLLRYHLRCLYVTLGVVLVGIPLSPGRAFAFAGRLSGIIWTMTPTQVAQYAGVAAGLTIILWLTRSLGGRIALLGVTLCVVLLLLTHTRTALVSLGAGVLIAGLSLFHVNARVRRFFAAGVAVVSIAIVTAAGVLTTWLARGQSTQGLLTLTGRTNFWALVLNTPRDRIQEIFGFGLSNASVNGLPIDSNWLAAYMQEGLFGVAICALILLFMLVYAFFQAPSQRAALALFILVYCLVDSFTEDAFTDVSTYLLHLTIAASLLAVVPLTRRDRSHAIAPFPDGTVQW